ncbi:MAG: sigma 54-interacting transcriptional regulator [bacterium]
MKHNTKESSLESIALQMTSSLNLEEVLVAITQGLVDELDAAFARIWLLGPGDLCAECCKADSYTNRERCLHLRASAGIYTRINGEYRRVPLGAFKIGLIAQNQEPVVTNDAQEDKRLPNKSWLKENELRSFAGYPLVFRDDLLGVIAMFSRRVMSQEEFNRMAVFANQAAVAIKNAQLFQVVRDRETECRAIIESTPNPLLITRKKDGQILYANAHFGAVFGLAPEQLLGRKAPDLYYEPDGRQRLLTELAKSGVVQDYEIRVKKLDGSPLWVSMSVQPLIFHKEQALVTILSDIHDRKTAEMALRELQRKSDLILKSAGEGIYGLDLEGHTTFVNPAAAEILGWEPEDLLGKPQHALIHHTKPDSSPYDRKDCPIYAAFRDGEVHTVTDEVFWRKDGTSLPVEYTSTPIRDDEDNLVGAVVTFRDIAERKQAEKELHDALKEVQQLKDRLQAENVYLQEEIKLEHNFDEIISMSASFKKVLRNVERVAATDATVLILGETGTGKELIARALHTLSIRKDRPLVKVNCAALPANLIESELFGHEKGAFTGAMSRKQGRFELADRGTIFLDEIGDLPLELQSNLLRVLQEGEFERVGGTQTLKVDVRIAATNRDLEKAIQAGEFREDLYYRLHVFPILLPPLRERPEDIPLLVNHFIQKGNARFGKKISSVPEKQMQLLRAYHFPGNIRELENIVERAMILSLEQTLHLEETFGTVDEPAGSIAMSGTLQEVERDYILAVLQETNWRIEGPKGAALRLGLNPNTLRSRMQKLGIKRSSTGTISES